MARAIATSCCTASECDAELRSRVDVEPEVGQAAARRRAASRRQSIAPKRRGSPAEPDVLGDGQVRQQVDLLVDRADAGGAARRAAIEKRTGSPPSRISPASRRSGTGRAARCSVDLPAPFSPISECTSPGNIAEVDVVERRLRPKRTVAPEDLEDRRRAVRPCSPSCRASCSPCQARSAWRITADAPSTWRARRSLAARRRTRAAGRRS